MPKFSIIIALYNQAEYLQQLMLALEAQTFQDFEVHFCDDGSTDETEDYFCDEKEIIDHTPIGTDAERDIHFPYKYHRQLNSGSYAANMNQGVKVARGEYCVFLAGDSFPEPDYLEILNEWVQPQRVVCGIRIQVDGGQGVDLDWRLKKELIPTFPAIMPDKPWNKLTGNGLTVPTAALSLYGPWNEDFVGYGGEDNELIARLYFKGYICYSVPDLRVYHHWHISHNSKKDTNDRANKLIESYAS